MTAAVPTLVKTQPITDLSFQADASVDAVVSLCALGQLQPAERAKAVREAQVCACSTSWCSMVCA